MQEEAYQLVLSCKDGETEKQALIGIFIAGYNKATEGRLKTEDAVREQAVKAQRLITYEDATKLCAAAWMPLISRLWNLGKTNAAKANPNDPVLAESVIAQAIRGAVKEAQSAVFPLPDASQLELLPVAL